MLSKKERTQRSLEKPQEYLDLSNVYDFLASNLEFSVQQDFSYAIFKVGSIHRAQSYSQQIFMLWKFQKMIKKCWHEQKQANSSIDFYQSQIFKIAQILNTDKITVSSPYYKFL